MVLDSLNSETPNIKDLSLVESIKTEKLYFNPEKQLSTEFIEFALKQIEESKEEFAKTTITDTNKGKFEESAEIAALELSCLKVLFPDKVDELKLDDRTFEFLALLDPTKSFPVIRSGIMTRLASWRLLYPDQVASTGYYQNLKKSIDKDLKTAKTAPFANYFDLAYQAKLINIEYSDEILSEQGWEREILAIEAYKSTKSWKDVVPNLAKIKVIGPERFARIKISKEDWEEMILFFNSINIYESGASGATAWKLKTALELAIISANQVIIDNEGMHLISKPPDQYLEESSPPLPETRNF